MHTYIAVFDDKTTLTISCDSRLDAWDKAEHYASMNEKNLVSIELLEY